ncbi:MAG: DUF3943 domain-containing protein [Muribaculaceae bacterium]|nr:DUF3943 domain-containing protein [Muribaculaceae bacterium]
MTVFAGYPQSQAAPVLPDSTDIRLHEHKAFWRASAETVGFNLGLWSFDRYVVKGQYAYISWNTIKENFRHGFEWDDDHLHTNMFAHPYNGSIFFNAGRSNGYNFWQSELFAIGGSAMWEMFMEREYPSTNDIIATPIGGAALGEVFYRTSDLILDDRATGGERFGRELAAFIVDPMKGINRIVTGAAWKKRPTSGRRFGVPPIGMELSLGGRFISLTENDEGSRAGAVAEINIEYGDRFAETTKVPYDYFSFQMELQGIKSQPLLSRVEIMGRLLSKEIVDKKDLNLNVGLYQHFDYFDSDTIRPERKAIFFPCSVPYKMGTPASVGGGFMVRYQPSKTSCFDGFLHLNGVALAGILTDFYRDYNRNYNWGSGFSIKSGLKWTLSDDRLSVRLSNQFYKIYTWNGYDANYDWSLTPEGKPVDVQGDASHSSFNHFEASVNYRLWKRIYLTGGVDYYSRRTEYGGMSVRIDHTTYSSPIIHSKQLGAHLMLTYKL